MYFHCNHQPDTFDDFSIVEDYVNLCLRLYNI